MGKTIKARFSKGVIGPMEKIDIAEGKEITITLARLCRNRIKYNCQATTETTDFTDYTEKTYKKRGFYTVIL